MILWASGDSSPTVFLNPVNPSMATTSNRLRPDSPRAAIQALRAFLDRPEATSRGRAGPLRSRTGVGSMTTVT